MHATFTVKLSTVKRVVRFVVAASTGATVQRALNNNLLPPTKTSEKVSNAVGSLVLGSMVADRAAAWVDTLYDNAHDTAEQIAEMTADNT